MWRPEGWENPFQDARIASTFEAGATAMLVALKKQGEYVDASKAPYGYVFNAVAKYPRTFKGYFVLIPEEVNGGSPDS